MLLNNDSLRVQAGKLDELVKQTGWTEVILPLIEAREKGLIELLLQSQPYETDCEIKGRIDEMRNFLKAIDNIMEQAATPE